MGWRVKGKRKMTDSDITVRGAPFLQHHGPFCLRSRRHSVQVCGLLPFKEKECIAICSHYFFYLGKWLLLGEKSTPTELGKQVEQNTCEKLEVALPPEWGENPGDNEDWLLLPCGQGKQREARLIRKWKIPTGNPEDADCGYCTSGQFSFISWTQGAGFGEFIFDWLESGRKII